MTAEDIVQLRQVFGEMLDKALQANNAQLEKRLAATFATKADVRHIIDERLELTLELTFAGFYGQMQQLLTDRMDAFEVKIDKRIDSLFRLVDGFTKRLDDDDVERAAITHRLNRHGQWLGELSSGTGIELST